MYRGVAVLEFVKMALLKYCPRTFIRGYSGLASVSSQHGAWYRESLERPEEFWGRLARDRIRWIKDYTDVMKCRMETAEFRWFEGGQLNVSGNRNTLL